MPKRVFLLIAAIPAAFVAITSFLAAVPAAKEGAKFLGDGVKTLADSGFPWAWLTCAISVLVVLALSLLWIALEVRAAAAKVLAAVGSARTGVEAAVAAESTKTRKLLSSAPDAAAVQPIGDRLAGLEEQVRSLAGREPRVK